MPPSFEFGAWSSDQEQMVLLPMPQFMIEGGTEQDREYAFLQRSLMFISISLS
jgi:hypothetical protein